MSYSIPHLTLVDMLSGRYPSRESDKFNPGLNFATVWLYGLGQVLKVLWVSDSTSGNDGNDIIVKHHQH